MKRGKFDRNARTGHNAPSAAHPSDHFDGMAIGLKETFGIVIRQSGLPQHVEAVGISASFVEFAAFDRRADAFSHDELSAQQLHRQFGSFTYHRLTATRHQPNQRIAQRLVASGRNQFSRNHQPPGRRADKHGIATPEMRLPSAF